MIFAYVLVAVLTKTYFSSEVPIPVRLEESYKDEVEVDDQIKKQPENSITDEDLNETGEDGYKEQHDDTLESSEEEEHRDDTGKDSYEESDDDISDYTETGEDSDEEYHYDTSDNSEVEHQDEIGEVGYDETDCETGGETDDGITKETDDKILDYDDEEETHEEIDYEETPETIEKIPDHDVNGNPKLVQVENKPGDNNSDSGPQYTSDKAETGKDDVAKDSKENTQILRDLWVLAEAYRRGSWKPFTEHLTNLYNSSEYIEEHEEEGHNEGHRHIGPQIYVHPRNSSHGLEHRLEDNEAALFIKLKVMEFLSIFLANLFNFVLRICDMFYEG
ncbi:hypothetical protein RF11_05807 [Thelohanellus kitauei]|uniref:Uncharacterized protein n=1 Tax=Thelohanellus kitauei TaxID=669202 RepID=A0A0C2M217_THEKT|nr:hypothetical protein RF11_05807 [Thelohanellus kitauei]